MGDLGSGGDGLSLLQRVLPAHPAAVVLLVVVVVPDSALLREQLVLGQLELDRLGMLLTVSQQHGAVEYVKLLPAVSYNAAI